MDILRSLQHTLRKKNFNLCGNSSDLMDISIILWELILFLENWNIPVYVEEEDLPIMTDPELNLSSSYTNGYSFDGAKPLKDGQKTGTGR